MIKKFSALKTADEVAEEIDQFPGTHKKFKRVDHAKKYLAKLIVAQPEYATEEVVAEAQAFLNNDSNADLAKPPSTTAEKKAKAQADKEAARKAKEEAKAKEKQEREEAKAKAKADREAAKAKPKEAAVRQWDTGHEHVGQMVFSPKGRGTVKAVDAGAGRALVAVGGFDHDVSLSACHWQAVDDKYRSRYPVDKDVRTPSGKPSMGVDDELTDALKGTGADYLHELCNANGLPYERYAHLNPGMQRMSIGNRLRARLKKGESVNFPPKPAKAEPAAEENAA